MRFGTIGDSVRRLPTVQQVRGSAAEEHWGSLFVQGINCNRINHDGSYDWNGGQFRVTRPEPVVCGREPELLSLYGAVILIVIARLLLNHYIAQIQSSPQRPTSLCRKLPFPISNICKPESVSASRRFTQTVHVKLYCTQFLLRFVA